MAVAASEGKILLTPDKGRRVVLEFIRERLPAVLELDLRERLTVVGPNRIQVR